MKKFLIKVLCLLFTSYYFLKVEKSIAIIPYYYLPSVENLEKESLSIGKMAYQLLLFGQIEDSLKLAKLAVKLNNNDETLWAILADTQIANKKYKEALLSIKKAKEINSMMGELYFAESSIYLKIDNLKEAKIALKKGLKIEEKNYKAIFQLGNIFLMEKNYKEAIIQFNKAIIIQSDFWQAVNNQGLANFELNNIELAIKSFKKAISINENAEPMLALAASLNRKNNIKAISLARKALINDPNYVSYEYRKEQLWGEKLQIATKELLKKEELKLDIDLAKTKKI